jgi:alkylation response protein AidB-like acyl-CoA dehydrogenase
MNEFADPEIILSPDDPALVLLCNALRDLSSQLDYSATAGETPWPRQQLELCGKYGVFKWFIDDEHGGLGWSAVDLARGYLALGAACQTTTFIITQRRITTLHGKHYFPTC